MNAFLVVAIVVPALALALAVNVARHDAQRVRARSRVEKSPKEAAPPATKA